MLVYFVYHLTGIAVNLALPTFATWLVRALKLLLFQLFENI